MTNHHVSTLNSFVSTWGWDLNLTEDEVAKYISIGVSVLVGGPLLGLWIKRIYKKKFKKKSLNIENKKSCSFQEWNTKKSVTKKMLEKIVHKKKKSTFDHWRKMPKINKEMPKIKENSNLEEVILNIEDLKEVPASAVVKGREENNFVEEKENLKVFEDNSSKDVENNKFTAIDDDEFVELKPTFTYAPYEDFSDDEEEVKVQIKHNSMESKGPVNNENSKIDSLDSDIISKEKMKLSNNEKEESLNFSLNDTEKNSDNKSFDNNSDNKKINIDSESNYDNFERKDNFKSDYDKFESKDNALPKYLESTEKVSKEVIKNLKNVSIEDDAYIGPVYDTNNKMDSSISNLFKIVQRNVIKNSIIRSKDNKKDSDINNSLKVENNTKVENDFYEHFQKYKDYKREIYTNNEEII